ncbi:MAG TPA: alpha/beta fold hydrolase [Egibacteraceae bacterium]|nr:alpha/beta fold hydrolase [Egibacteraceae bacterium]
MGVRGRRWLRWTIAGLLALLLIGLLGAGWYYADEILTPAPWEEAVRDVRVEGVDDEQIVLDRTEDSERPGVLGLEFEDGYAQVGTVTSADAGTVTRELRWLSGELRPGEMVYVDGFSFSSDPDRAFDFPVEDVLIDSPLGPFPAWLSKGERSTWVIGVHGRGVGREELFRMFPIMRDLGLPMLSISYRNDPDVPPSPDGLYGMGATEWEDVQAAVDYALASGADELIIVGYSTGGAIVSTWLHESEDAERVAGVILDAPVLDWGPVLDLAAVDRGVPTWLRPIAQAVSTLRTGIRWDRLNQVARADEFAHPILLFHGSNDQTVPVELSDAFAEARPDLVTYVRTDGRHVRSWNEDPDAYAASVRGFVERVTG